MNPLVEALKYFAIIMAELTVLFIAISALVALALMYLPPNKLRDWMSGKGILGNIIGVLFGAVTPFCACSTVPITVGLLQAGVPFGTVTSLVIASPLLDPLVFTMLAAFMGLDVAVGFLALTSVAAVVFGVILDKAGDASQVKRVRVKGGGHDLSEEAPSGFATRLKLSLLKAWVDFRSVVVYMVVGVAIGASIYGYLPEDLLASVAGRDNPFAVLAVALIGMPLYIRVESALLIGLALLDKGASMGAVMALIISGAGIAILEITMFAGIFKRPLIMAFLGDRFRNGGGLWTNLQCGAVTRAGQLTPSWPAVTIVALERARQRRVGSNPMDYTSRGYWNGIIKMSLSKRFILWVLYDQPMHGYEIARTVGTVTNGCCTPTEGTIYPVLREFEAGGYVTTKTATVSGRERRVYTLSPKGRLSFQVAVEAWKEVTDYVLQAAKTPEATAER